MPQIIVLICNPEQCMTRMRPVLGHDLLRGSITACLRRKMGEKRMDNSTLPIEEAV